MHLGLLRAYEALKEPAEAARARHAASVLLGVSEQEATEIAARMLGQDNPVEVNVPPPTHEAPVDAGIPQHSDPANAPKVR